MGMNYFSDVTHLNCCILFLYKTQNNSVQACAVHECVHTYADICFLNCVYVYMYFYALLALFCMVC